MVEIQLVNIVKDIKKARVLNNLDLTLTDGKIYGLRGKNGCGKTMLLRTICGLIIPTEGEVIINGKVLHKDMS
jgi:ABC-2 type transport system ATP-binding protein